MSFAIVSASALTTDEVIQEDVFIGPFATREDAEDFAWSPYGEKARLRVVELREPAPDYKDYLAPYAGGQ